MDKTKEVLNVRKSIHSIFPDFLELKLSVLIHSRSKKKSPDAGNQLPPTFGMVAGWDMLVIQALELCASKARGTNYVVLN